MFGIIRPMIDNQQFICDCYCKTQKEAENIFFKYKILTGQHYTEISYSGTTVRIQSSQRKYVEKMKEVINMHYFMPPLEINVFWGKHKENISEKWCIGFNYPEPEKIIKQLNEQGRFILADKRPSNWISTNSESYSIVMPTRVIKKDLDEQFEAILKKDIQNYCIAIQIVTFRKIKIKCKAPDSNKIISDL